MDPKQINYATLDPTFRERLEEIEANSPTQKQLKALEKLAGVLTLLLDGVNQLNQQDLDGNEQMREILSDIRNAMEVINGKEEKEQPDFAKPVVATLRDLDKSISQALKGIDVRPEVNVAAPQVDVQAPKVDLKGIEKALKTELPKAFGEAIKNIPQAPETDLTPLEERLDRAIEQLESIDAASRMKPQFPSMMKVTNVDGSAVGGGGGLLTETYDYVGCTYPNSTTEVFTFKTGGSGGTTVAVITIVYTDSTKENMSSVTRT